MPSTRYVALPKKKERIYLYEADRSTKVQEVLWGDYLQVEQTMSGGWLKICWAPNTEKRILYIRKSQTVETRPLEIVFVDVGQGDGAVLITPEPDQSERVIVIDAGERENMHDFLKGRFGTYDTGRQFHAAVITHPDRDHYKGFGPIFEDESIGFDVVYHNGLIERPVSNEWPKVLGHTADPETGVRYVGSLAVDSDLVNETFAADVDVGAFNFANVMQAAVKNEHVKAFQMLGRPVDATEPVFVPDFGPDDAGDYSMEILGPIVERDDGGPRLRKLGDYGETKNGHSVLLRLTVGDFRILFGGDLNVPAEEFLLTHYTGLDEFPAKGSQRYQDMVADASHIFRSDLMKSCHHGSEKVTDAFLEAVNAAAFVISSGDNESYIHPRPDLLGRLGTFGRGERPVLLSTELQRSTRAREDEAVVADLMADVIALAAKTESDAAMGQEIADRVERLGRTNVSVWGSIYVKTDGQRLITAFKVETGTAKKKWFYYEYEWNDEGLLVLVD